MAHSDTGTVIPKETAALAINAQGELQLLLPKSDDDAVVPDHVMFLTAVMADTEPDFVREQIEWLRRQASD